MTSAQPIVTVPDGTPRGLPQRAVHDAMRLLLASAANRDALSGIEGGGVIEAFEQRFAEVAGAEFAVAVSSGGMALVVSLYAADIGLGDEVIVSPYGWGQTVAAVAVVGGTPVFADIDPDSGNLDPAAVATLVTPRTRAVVATHMYGCPARMDVLQDLCDRHGLILIADAAQALGARIKGRPIGAWGHISCFSLGRRKAVTTGEGGMICGNDVALRERVILVSQHPLRAFRELDDPLMRASIGEYNLSGRLSPLAAAIGLAQIAHLERTTRRRNDAAGRLARATGGSDSFRWQIPLGEGSSHAWYQLVARYDLRATGGRSREDVISDLRCLGVPATLGPIRSPIHYRPPFRVTGTWTPRAFRSRRHVTWNRGSCPHAEQRCLVEDVLVESTSNWEKTPSKRIAQLIQAFKEVASCGTRDASVGRLIAYIEDTLPTGVNNL